MEALAKLIKWIPLALLLASASVLVHSARESNPGPDHHCNVQAQMQQTECYENSWWWNLP